MPMHQSIQRSEVTPVRVVLTVKTGLPLVHAVNAATVLGASVGAAASLPLGPAGNDASGTRYPGIVTTPVPILHAPAEELTSLFRTANSDDELTVLCLTETARQARTYDDYLTTLATTNAADSNIIGLVIAGPRSKVTKLTKRLPLLGTT
ncbi:DUF2000 domain-containing protein [Kribbella capetownensis]|uniref:DUF2000 domain-containing protein n=1 Tax=Kribbella capetownensis TaxID=1572659 RepID=A0A4R0KAD7_9ACTN|nr:DUF2000 domain-containing protein [Kribbella capetownensis]